MSNKISYLLTHLSELDMFQENLLLYIHVTCGPQRVIQPTLTHTHRFRVAKIVAKILLHFCVEIFGVVRVDSERGPDAVLCQKIRGYAEGGREALWIAEWTDAA